ncbi:MAG: SPOR domain-containing protein [Deltaproteobacteria bacterium]|jgi:hypothetical protein|nr:SPOR domain-containing protein [Deltaproteobacteria bacterium]
MLKDFLLSPGRYLCRKFSGNKRKARFASRQAVRGPVVLVSLVSWLALAALSVVLVTRFASPPTPGVARSGEQGPRGEAAQGEAAQNEAAASAAASQPGAQAEGVQGAATAGDPAAVGQPTVEQALEPAGPEAAPQAGGEAWLVIVESIPKNKRAEAEQSQARHKRRGVELELFDTDAYPMLRSGMWTLAVGPFENKREADEAAAALRPKVRDLMVRRGL